MSQAPLPRSLELGPDTLRHWIEGIHRRSWNLHRDLHLKQDLAAQCQPLWRELNAGILHCETRSAADPAFREFIRLLSFTAGWCAGKKLSISVALALPLSLDETLPEMFPRSFLEASLLAVTEAYTASLRQALHEAHEQIIGKAEVVHFLRDTLPACFLVGDPSTMILDNVVGQLGMAIAMREASFALVDLSGIFDATTFRINALLDLLMAYRGTQTVTIVLSGLAEPLLDNASAFQKDHAWLLIVERVSDAISLIENPHDR